MNKAIWFMEGVSSQKDILAAVKLMRDAGQHPFSIIASHRQYRPEILAQADHAWLEPTDEAELLPFITAIVRRHRVTAIHTGKRCTFYESHRQQIEALGVKLTTGARDVDTHAVADDKLRFSEMLAAEGLATVPSILVKTPEEIAAALTSPLLADAQPCIKPVHGIYGLGFWVIKNSASRMQCFSNPDMRIIHPEVLLQTLSCARDAGETLAAQIVMPWLPGPERSVDMLVENGRVLAAVARCKTGSVQTLENDGAAWDLALACARYLKLDGLINVQTRNNAAGEPVLLEANLRPSGGIGYTLHSRINLPGLFALRQLGLLDEAGLAAHVAGFTPCKVTPTHAVQPLPECEVGTPQSLADASQEC